MQRSTSFRSMVLAGAGLFSAIAMGCSAGGTAGGGTGAVTGTGGGGMARTGGRTGSTFGTGGSNVGPGSGGSNVGPGSGGTNVGPGSGGTAPVGTGGAGGAPARPAACAVAGPDVISDFEENQGVMVRQGTPVRTGWWYTYYPGSPAALMAGQMQTPPPSAGPIAVAADPMATNAACNKALHLTGSGFTGANNYSGAGAGFLPMPAPSQVKSPYDLTAYSGISFKIRSGSATPQPAVYFEMLTRDTQPATSGGTATVMTIDLNNNRGKMIAPPWVPTAISPTWQTVTVPFGNLIPRWVPAVGGMACPAPAAGVPRCQAPKFNPANVLGFQISMLADPGFPRPAGSTLGTYDLWIDDVTLVRNDAGLPTRPGFPNDSPGTTLGPCVKPAGALGKFLVQPYNLWKEWFTTNDQGNIRVRRPESNNDSVSEGIAYGMLIAVYMNDQPLFDGLWAYWKAHSATADGPLMTWQIPGGTGTATDADEDAAFAMLQASKKWPTTTTYASDALNLMHALLAHDMSGTFIKGGSNYGPGDVTNPSYFAPGYYRAFAAADTANAAAWNGLAAGTYTLLGNISGTSTNGLFAAWCGSNCTTIATNAGSANPTTDVIYQYDSHRIPWRVGLDYCWNSTSPNAAAAKAYLTRTSGFFMGQSANGVGRIADLYSPAGNPFTGAAPNSGSAIGTAAVGAMSDAMYSTFVTDAYQLVLDMTTRGRLAEYGDGTLSAYSYYNATVGMLTLLSMTGNLRPL